MCGSGQIASIERILMLRLTAEKEAKVAKKAEEDETKKRKREERLVKKKEREELAQAKQRRKMAREAENRRLAEATRVYVCRFRGCNRPWVPTTNNRDVLGFMWCDKCDFGISGACYAKRSGQAFLRRHEVECDGGE